ncbi:MAG TPA: hypothetical protein PKE30_05205 [Niabella sp.]|nr:hypothetical protein [Niabella sp.]
MRLLGVPFNAADHPQTLEEYTKELEEGDAEIDNSAYITMEHLL